MIYRITTAASDCRGHRLPRAFGGSAAVRSARGRPPPPRTRAARRANGRPVWVRARAWYRHSGRGRRETWRVRFQSRLVKKNAVKAAVRAKTVETRKRFYERLPVSNVFWYCFIARNTDDNNYCNVIMLRKVIRPYWTGIEWWDCSDSPAALLYHIPYYNRYLRTSTSGMIFWRWGRVRKVLLSSARI